MEAYNRRLHCLACMTYAIYEGLLVLRQFGAGEHTVYTCDTAFSALSSVVLMMWAPVLGGKR